MARSSFLSQSAMSAGEIAPYLWGRVDQALYYIGLRTCRNMAVRQYGGACNRGGSYFVGECEQSQYPVRIIPFSFNEEQTYIIQLGHFHARFIANGGEVVELPKTITGITKANPAVITSAGHGLSNGNDVYLAGIVGMTELNGRTVRIKNVTANTFEITDYQGNNINTTGFTAYSSGGTASRVYTVGTPWSSADLFDLNFAAKNDVLTVVHPNYKPTDMTRTGNTAWTVTDFDVTQGPFKDKNATATTVIASAVSGAGITLTASAALFTASMVNQLFYIEQEPSDATKTWEVGKAIAVNDIRRAGANYYKALNAATTGTVKPDHTEGSATDGDNGVRWNYLHSGFGIVKITAYTDSTHVTATVINRLPENCTTTATTIWSKAAWSSDEGYPSAAAYHKQRFVLGGTKNAPNRLWFSGVGLRAFFGKSNPILADESFKLDLDTTEVNAIRHLLPLKQLIATTSASEQLINGQNNVLDATAPPVADVQGYTGSAKVKPLIIGNTALYVEDTGDVVRSLQYDLNSDSFTGIDLTARSPHLFEGKRIVDWAFQRRPLSVVWTVMSDGALNGFTFMPEQKFYAWHRHDTDGSYKSVACIREGNETAVYQVVERTVNGVARKYIERHASRIIPKDSILGTKARDQMFVDCGLTYDGRNKTATTMTISGGTTWDSPEVLTLTASASTFTAADVGNQINFWYSDADGNSICLRLTISAYTSGTVVSVIPTKLVPASHRAVARTDWEFAKKRFTNFSHLAGKAAAVLSDGNVVKGLSFDSNGFLTLPEPGAVVHAGLGYVSDLETLDLAGDEGSPGQLRARSANVPRLFITAYETRALYASINGFDDAVIDLTDPNSKFMELKPRDPDIGYDLPIPPGSDLYEITLNSQWSNRQRICIRNVDPVAMTINSIIPEAVLGYS
jgi:hypothetical protein